MDTQDSISIPYLIVEERDNQKEMVDLSMLSDQVRRRLKEDGPLGLGEAYIDGLWDTPYLDQFMYKLFTSPAGLERHAKGGKLFLYLIKQFLLNPQQGRGAFKIGRFHYDLGNDLFQAMLDHSMSYTCGYWKAAQNLEEAQRAKLELICRKLELKPGMSVADIGCGWGNFAKYAAENWGVSVVGVTVSEEQASYARQVCRGLPVSIVLADYRKLSEKFDRVVSIEMIEAVGRKNLPQFFQCMHDLLKDNGRFVLQAISAETVSTHSVRYLDQFLIWILKYIFPDGYLPKFPELTAPTRNLFTLQECENLSPSYDRTLMAWADNFNANWPDLSEKYGERFRRRWIYYLYSCAAVFRAGLVDVYQLVYRKRL